MNEDAHDWANSVDDIDNWFNPDKHTNSGAYVQMNTTTHTNVTVNATGNMTANATSNTSANAT